MSNGKYMTSWCGGEPANKTCNFNCKLCLILGGKAELTDIQGSKLIYKITNELVGNK